MSHPHNYGESVLFTFIKDGKILCEWRERFGIAQYSIPGGKVDPMDRDQDDYQKTTLIRETWEEFRVTPTQFQRIGEIWYKDEWLFHVYIINALEGEIPARIFDSHRQLDWIEPTDLEDNIYMSGISALIQRTLSS
jgi:8-oxo-dGTP pyrophosphatase MutT (NUDIX family)